MTTVAFCGLGRMGRLMAGRLLDAGHQVTVWNRSDGPQRELAERGAAVATSPREAAAASEVTITMLTGPEALEQVVLGPDGVAAGLEDGAVLVDMSTVGPEAFLAVAERLTAGSAVDAPVRGSLPQAAEGTLQIYVGADDRSFRRVAPVLELLGDLRHVGPPGAGAATKLVVNTALVGSAALLGECMALGAGLGLDRATLLDVLGRTPVGPTVASKGKNVAEGRYPPAFEARLAAKDVHLVVEAARRLGVRMPLADATETWMDATVDAADGDVDFSAVVATVMGEAVRP